MNSVQPVYDDLNVDKLAVVCTLLLTRYFTHQILFNFKYLVKYNVYMKLGGTNVWIGRTFCGKITN